MAQGRNYSWNLHISRGPLGSGKIWGLKSNFRSMAIWRYHSPINSTSAQNKQSIFVLLSHHQKCTLIGEITGLYFSWIVEKNSKIPHNFSLWQVLQFIYWFIFRSGITWQFLMVQNNSLHRHPLALWKHSSSAVCRLVNTQIYFSL